MCHSYCADAGYFYYGTQYGSECWCGDEDADFDQYGSATCDLPCAGDPTVYCGGSYAMTVYTVGTSCPLTV